MNCQEFWDSMPEPGAGDRLEHLRECTACARRMNEHRRLLADLSALREEWRSVEAPARVEHSVVAAFRSQAAFRRARSLRHSWVPLFTWASAAAFLVALALLLVRPHEPPAAHHLAHPGGVQLAVLPAATATPDTAADDADADGFIPLPDAQRIAPSDTMNVVRVEVPRSAMLAVGLSVSPDRVSELVEADVMMGSDGLARAVRFIE